MSFYSELILFANRNVSRLDAKRGREVLVDCGLLADPENNQVDTLSMDVRELFDDSVAIAENDHFFHPSWISYSQEIWLFGEDGMVKLKGHGFSLNGYGYLYPWTHSDVTERVLVHPKLIQLRDTVQSEFGGRYRKPLTLPILTNSKSVLKECTIDHGRNWAWFASENV